MSSELCWLEMSDYSILMLIEMKHFITSLFYKLVNSVVIKHFSEQLTFKRHETASDQQLNIPNYNNILM